MDLNLSRTPFVNRRPVRRAGILLWVLALVLVALNAVTYWRHFSGENQNRGQLQQLQAEAAEEADRITTLRRRFAEVDVGGLNERTVFVNQRVEQRAFSWSTLFDRIAEVLPADVRLTSLSPDFDDQKKRGARGRRQQRELEAGEVTLGIEGMARNGEDILAFVDGLFEHQAFRSPSLENERPTDEGLVQFTLEVLYRSAPDPAADAESDARPDTVTPPSEVANSDDASAERGAPA